jgi:RNA chaperone Hfq
MEKPQKKPGRTLGAKVASINESDQPLTSLITNMLPVSIFLVNGVKLSGQVIWADQFLLVLRGDRDQILTRVNIASILPESGVFFI